MKIGISENTYFDPRYYTEKNEYGIASLKYSADDFTQENIWQGDIADKLRFLDYDDDTIKAITKRYSSSDVNVLNDSDSENFYRDIMKKYSTKPFYNFLSYGDSEIGNFGKYDNIINDVLKNGNNGSYDQVIQDAISELKTNYTKHKPFADTNSTRNTASANVGGIAAGLGQLGGIITDTIEHKAATDQTGLNEWQNKVAWDYSKFLESLLSENVTPTFWERLVKSGNSIIANAVNAPIYGMTFLTQGIMNLANGTNDTVSQDNKASMVYANSDKWQQDAVKGFNEAQTWLWNTGTSIVENILRRFTSLGNEALNFAMMGINVGSKQAYETSVKGGDYTQALLMGLSTAAAEILTEKIPFKHLKGLAPTGVEGAVLSIVKNIAIQVGEEFAEESINEITEMIADMAIMGDESELISYYNNYLKEHPDKKGDSAFWAVLGEATKQVALAGLQGAISGGIQGGGAIAIGNATNVISANNSNKAKARDFVNSGKFSKEAAKGYVKGTQETLKETYRSQKLQGASYNAIEIAKKELSKNKDTIKNLELTSNLKILDKYNNSGLAKDSYTRQELAELVSNSFNYHDSVIENINFDADSQQDALINGLAQGKLSSEDIDTLDALTKATGVNFVFTQGNNYNGFYSPNNNSTVIDTSQPINLESTVSHEWGHYLKAKYTSTFNDMVQFLKDNNDKQITIVDQDTNAKKKTTIGQLLDDAEKTFNTKGMDEDVLEEERVARFVELALFNRKGKVTTKTNELMSILTGVKDRTRIQKMFKSFRNFAKKLGKSGEGIVDVTDEFLAKLEETYSTPVKHPEKSNERLSKKDINPSNPRDRFKFGETRFSREFNDEINARQIGYNKDHKLIPTNTLNNAVKCMTEMVKVMKGFEDMLPADIVGKVFKTDSSYGGSIENTTICVRTLAYNIFVQKVQEKIGRPLTVDESFLASQMLYHIAKEPQCLYCYVSLDRKAYNEFLKRYIDDAEIKSGKKTIIQIGRDTVIKRYKEMSASDKKKTRKLPLDSEWSKAKNRAKAMEENPLYYEFLNKRKNTENMRERFSLWLDLADNNSKLVTLKDLSTSARMTKIERGNDELLKKQLADIMAYARSASWAKIEEDYVAYYNDIMKLSNETIDKLNQGFGLRFYSFSDYSAAFILENMQEITDASLRGLKGLAYTKDLDFVKIFAKTGININVSIFIRRDSESGEYFIDGRQSAVGIGNLKHPELQELIDLRNQYPNVGVVAVATDDDAVRWALNQDYTDVVIPFHIVRTGDLVAKNYEWMNYKTQQAEKVKSKAMWEKHLIDNGLDEKTSKEIYPPEHHNDKETYLRLAKERGLTAKFPRFTNEPNYMKLVNETRQTAAETKPLQPIFDLEAAKESFNYFTANGGYFGGYYLDGIEENDFVDQVVHDVEAIERGEMTFDDISYKYKDMSLSELKKIYKAYKKLGTKTHNGVRMSMDVDSEGNKLSMEQAEFFKDSKMRNDKGELMVMHHGTSASEFTIFDPINSRDKLSLFFTDNMNVAKNYQDWRLKKDNPGHIFNVYLNIKNPLIIDAKGSDWKAIDFEISNEGKIEKNQYTSRYWFNTKKDKDNFEKMFPNLEELESLYHKALEDDEYDFSANYNGENYDGSEIIDLYEETIRNADKEYFTYNYDNTETKKLKDFIDNPNMYSWFDYDIINQMVFRGNGATSDELINDGLTLEDAANGLMDYAKDITDGEGNTIDEFLNQIVYLRTQEASPNKKILHSTRAITKYAKENGYDGVIFKNVDDALWDSIKSTVGVVFNGNQVKSIDNTNPSNNDNIRFSIDIESMVDDYIEEHKDELTRSYVDNMYMNASGDEEWFAELVNLSVEDASKLSESEWKELFTKQIKGNINNILHDDFGDEIKDEIYEKETEKYYDMVNEFSSDIEEFVDKLNDKYHTDFYIDHEESRSWASGRFVSNYFILKDSDNEEYLKIRFSDGHNNGRNDNDYDIDYHNYDAKIREKIFDHIRYYMEDFSNTGIRYSKDKDSDGNALTQDQAEFFKDSKARDDNGNLVVVYHGSFNDFTIFDKSMSENAFFFTDDSINAMSYAGLIKTKDNYLYKAYLNLKNPYVVDAKNKFWNKLDTGEKTKNGRATWGVAKKLLLSGKITTFEQLRSLIESIDPFDFLDGLNDEISIHLDEGKTWEEIEKYLLSKEEIETLINFVDDEYELEDDEIVHLGDYIDGVDTFDVIKYTNTREIAEQALKDGYDGVIFKNIVDYGDSAITPIMKPNNVYVAFNSNQIKLTTNEHPTLNEDVRFSRDKDQLTTDIANKVQKIAQITYGYHNDPMIGDMRKSNAYAIAKEILLNAPGLSPEHIDKFADDIANTMMDNIVVNNYMVDDDNKLSLNEAKRIIEEANYYRHKVNITDRMKSEINYAYDKDAKSIYLQWQAKKGTSGTNPWDMFEELSAKGINFASDDDSEEEIFIKFLDLVSEAQNFVKNYDEVTGAEARKTWSEPEIEFYKNKMRDSLVTLLTPYINNKALLLKNETDKIKEKYKKEYQKKLDNAISSIKVEETEKLERLSESYKKEYENKLAIDRARLENEKQIAEKEAAYDVSRLGDRINALLNEIDQKNKEVWEANESNKFENTIIENINKIINFKGSTALMQDQEFLTAIKGIRTLKFRGNIVISSARKHIADLATWYKKDNELLGDLYDPAIAEAIDNIAANRTETYTTKKGIEKTKANKSALSLEELKLVDKIVKHLKSIIVNYDKAWKGEKLVNIKNVASPAVKLAEDFAGFSHKNKIWSWMKAFGNAIVEPRDVIKSLFGYQDNALSDFYEEIVKGETEANYITYLLRQKIKDFYKSHKGYEKSLREEVEFQGVKYTKGKLLSLYKLAIQSHSRVAITWTGFGFKDKSNYWVECKPLSESAYKELMVLPNETDKEFLKMVVDFFNDGAAYQMETDEKYKGYTTIDPKTSSTYFPINRKSLDRAKDLSTGFIDEMTQDAVANMSINKSRIKNQKRIELFDIDVVLDRYATQVGKYAGLAVPIKSFQRLYNMNISQSANLPITLRNVLNEKVWNKAGDYLSDLLGDIQGMNKNTSSISRLFGTVRGYYAMYQLGANVKVVMSQMASYPTAFSELDFAPMMKALTPRKISFKEMDKYSKLALTRNAGNESAHAETLVDKYNKVANIFQKPIGISDRITIGLIWNASQFQVEKNHKGDPNYKFGTEANKEEAAVILENAIRKTQPNYTTTERTQMQRSKNELVKTFAMFTAVPSKQLSRLIGSIGEYNGLLYAQKKLNQDTSAKQKKALKNVLKAITAVTVANLVYVLMGSLVKHIFDKDRKDKDGNEISLTQDILMDFASTTVGMIPIAKDIYGMIVNGYDIDAGSYLSGGVSDIVNSTIAICELIAKAANGEIPKDTQIANTLKSMAYGIGTMTGIPVRNVYNTVYGLIKRFDSSTAYKMQKMFTSSNYLPKLEDSNDPKLSKTIISNKINISDSKIVGEYYNIYSESGEIDYPRTIDSVITYGGQEYSLNKTQLKQMEELYSESIADINNLIVTEGYKNLSYKEKNSAMNSIYDSYYQYAVNKVLGKNSILGSLPNVVHMDTYALAKSYFNSIKSDTDSNGKTIAGSKKKKFIEYVYSLNISNAERCFLIAYMGYSLDGIPGKTKEAAEKLCAKYIDAQDISDEQKKTLKTKCKV